MVTALQSRWSVELVLGAVPEELEGAVLSRPTYEVAPGQFLFRLPRLGRVLVEGGRSMTLELLGDADLESWDALLAGAPLAALLAQRGLLALHGSTVALKGRAVTIVGDSGAGKSTTAATLAVRGHHLVADDVSPIRLDGDGGAVAEPARPDVWLFPDSLESVGRSPDAGRSVRPGVRKRRIDLPTSDVPVPLGAVVELRTGGPSAISVRLDRAEAIQVVLRSTLAAGFLVGAGLAPQHLTWVQGLVFRTPFFRIERPRTGWTAAEVADLVEQLPRA